MAWSSSAATTTPLDDGMGQWSLARDPARPFDVGGDARLQLPLAKEVKGTARWEIETHALFLTVVKNGLMRVDELRAGIERLDPERYGTWGYYDKWASSIAHALLGRGLVSEDALNAALGDVSSSAEPAFAVGAVVRVKRERAPVKHRKPHVRVPAYVHGAVGVVDAYRGSFEDPEFLAFRGTAEPQPLYTVKFARAALGWGDGSREDTVCAEVYQSWLEPASDADLADAASAAHAVGHVINHQKASSRHDHDHEHSSRYETECEAVAAQGAETPGERLTAALLATLTAAGLVEVAAFRQMVAAVEVMAAPLRPDSIGPRVVARAWKDPDFKRRLLEDAAKALADDFGFAAVNSTAAVKLVAVANEPGLHNLTVCTLCSCYPLTILGLSPSWYKDVRFRARAVREPRKLLRDTFDLHLADDVKLNVLDSTADCRYIVIPEPPAALHTNPDLDEATLAKLVSRDAMVGVARVQEPLFSRVAEAAVEEK